MDNDEPLRPRIFVSSVMDGFEQFRNAARHGIEAAGATPILVEDFPSLPESSRTACLDGVASSDALLVIIGDRGGWRAPSGKLVVEEEFEEAHRRGLPVVLLLQNTSRDDDAQLLARKMSDYVDGLFRKTFSNPGELISEVQSAISPLVDHHQEPMMDDSVVMERLNSKSLNHQGNEANLRFVIAPERTDELIDIVELDSYELKNQIYEIGTSHDVRLLSHERSKRATTRVDTLVIEQNSQNTSWQREGVDNVFLEISYRGVITIEVNVTGRSASDWRGFSHSVILRPDIEDGLRRCIKFAAALYKKRDPYKRYSRLKFNAALNNLGYRSFRSEPVTDNSLELRTNGSNFVLAFDEPRLITRGQLEAPDEQIGNTLAMFRRRLQNPN